MSKSLFLIVLTSAVVLGGEVRRANTIAAVSEKLARNLLSRGRAKDYSGDEPPSVVVDDDGDAIHPDIEAHELDRAEQAAEAASGETASNDAANAAPPKPKRGRGKA